MIKESADVRENFGGSRKTSWLFLPSPSPPDSGASGRRRVRSSRRERDSIYGFAVTVIAVLPLTKGAKGEPFPKIPGPKKDDKV